MTSPLSRRWLSLLVACSLAAGLGACGDDDDDSGTPAGAAGSTGGTTSTGGTGPGGGGSSAGGTPGSAGTGGGGTGPGGSTSAGAGGATSAGSAGSTSTGSAGATSAGTGGATSPGAGGASGTGAQAGTSGQAGAPGTAGTSSGTAGTSASSDDPDQYCVDKINAYRATLGLPALGRWADGEVCADGQAKTDSEANKAHSAFGTCGESAQDECPGWSGPEKTLLDGCLKMMWDEGPGDDYAKHGHYINMSSTKYTKVACGFFKTSSGSYWAVQNFK